MQSPGVAPGVAPSASGEQAIPFIDPAMVPVVPVVPGGNMFDPQPNTFGGEVQELQQLEEVNQKLTDFKADVKDPNIGDTDKIQAGIDDLENIQRPFDEVDDGDDKDAIQVILNIINNMITNLQVHQNIYIPDIQKNYITNQMLYTAN